MMKGLDTQSLATSHNHQPIGDPLMSRRSHSGIAVFILGLAAAACGGGQPQQEAPPAAPPVAEVRPPLPGESVISGQIKFEGTAPPPRVVRMTSDPLCMSEGTTSEVLVVGANNGLQNVFVYVKDGLGDRTFPAPKTPVVLDQQGCRY